MASSSVARSNTIQTVRDYVTRMCTDVPGMKVLVMDAETTGVVSMVFTQTQVLQHEVFMTDTIERQAGEKMPHLKACYFVRPTAENLRRIQSELREPRFGEYHLFFSNTTRDGMIQQLAEADEHEVVQQVHEYFADYLPVTPDLFHLNVGSIAGLSGSVWEQAVFDRLHQGVCSLLLSLKKRPQIRYQRSSEVAQRVAETVLGTMDADPDLFAFRRPDVPPLLLIVDRRDDPVTPLLSQWTYQAMVHELVGISNNRVDLRGAPGEQTLRERGWGRGRGRGGGGRTHTRRGERERVWRRAVVRASGWLRAESGWPRGDRARVCAGVCVACVAGLLSCGCRRRQGAVNSVSSHLLL